MSTLTIRKIEDELKASLRMSAARHGRSMEEEARQLLRSSLMKPQPTTGLGTRIVERFQAVGGVELPLNERTPVRPPPDFTGQ